VAVNFQYVLGSAEDRLGFEVLTCHTQFASYRSSVRTYTYLSDYTIAENVQC
jgi:hypothetical protein